MQRKTVASWWGQDVSHNVGTCQPIPTFPMPPSQQTNVSCPFGPMGNQILRWKGWGRLEVQSRSCLVARHADIESGSQATAIGVALGSKTKVVFVCLCANFNTEEYSHLRSDAYHLTPSCVLSNGRRKRLWKGCEGVPLPKALEPKPQMYRKPIAVQKGSLINTKSVHDVNPSANMLAISLHFSRDMTPFAKPRGTCHSPKGWSTVRSSAAINFDAGRFCVWLIAHPLVIPLPIFSGQDSKDRRPSLDLKRNMKKLGDGINHQKKNNKKQQLISIFQIQWSFIKFAKIA